MRRIGLAFLALCFALATICMAATAHAQEPEPAPPSVEPAPEPERDLAADLTVALQVVTDVLAAHALGAAELAAAEAAEAEAEQAYLAAQQHTADVRTARSTSSEAIVDAARDAMQVLQDVVDAHGGS